MRLHVFQPHQAVEMFGPQQCPVGHLSALASICLAIVVRLRDVTACAGICYTSDSDAAKAKSQRSCICIWKARHAPTQVKQQLSDDVNGD